MKHSLGEEAKNIQNKKVPNYYMSHALLLISLILRAPQAWQDKRWERIGERIALGPLPLSLG